MPSRKLLILVVDDDPDLSRVIVDSLMDAGYEVATAVDGKDALAKLETFSPDVVVCDVEMPVMNGFDFCAAFRAMAKNRLVPFIFLTAFDSKERQRQARFVGADDFLLKPFDITDLLVMVKTRIARIEQIRESP